MGWHSLRRHLHRWDDESKPSRELEDAVQEVFAECGDDREALAMFSDALDPSLERGSDFLQLLARTQGAKSRCDAVWYGDTIAYGCKTCGLSSASCICVFCFNAGDHEGHDFYISRSDYGCCDCGDIYAWKRSGFCCHHPGPRREVDPTQLLPPATRRRSKLLVPAQLRRLVNYRPRVFPGDGGEAEAGGASGSSSLPPAAAAASADAGGDETPAAAGSAAEGTNGSAAMATVAEAAVDAAAAVAVVALAGTSPIAAGASAAAAVAVSTAKVGLADDSVRLLVTGINLRVSEEQFRDFLRERCLARPIQEVGRGAAIEELGGDAGITSVELLRDAETKASKGRALVTVEHRPAAFRVLQISGQVLNGSPLRVHQDVERVMRHLQSWEAHYEWLLSLGGFHDGLRRIIGNVFLDENLLSGQSAVEVLLLQSHLMEPSVRKLETNLMVDLMLDIDFKHRFAQVFTRLYRDLVLARAGNQDTNELGDFTCQIFTRQDVTLELVREHGLVRNLLGCLWDLLRPALIPFATPAVFDHESTIFRDHEIIQCSMDLLYVLDHAEVAREIIRTGPLRGKLWEGWLRVLITMQGMNPHERRTTTHVEYTSASWGNALTLHTDLMSNTWLILDAVESKADVEAVLHMARWTWSELRKWLLVVQVAEGRPSVSEPEGYIDFKVSRDKASFHAPVNRVLALLIHNLCQRGGQGNASASPTVFTSSRAVAMMATTTAPSSVRAAFEAAGLFSDADVLWWMEHPLRALVLHSQVAAGMWRRNGEAPENESEFYRMNYWHHLLVDMDLLVLRLASLVLPAEALFRTLFSRFELHRWLEPGDPLAILTEGAPADDEFAPQKLQSLVLLLYQLLSPRGPLSLSFQEMVVHTTRQYLSIGPRSHSQLWDPRLERSTATATANDQRMLEEALREISAFTKADGSGHSSAKYHLKDDQWVLVDPFFHLFSWSEQQKSEENVLAALKSKRQTLQQWIESAARLRPEPLALYRQGFWAFCACSIVQALCWLLLTKICFTNLKDGGFSPDGGGRLLVLALNLALRSVQAPRLSDVQAASAGAGDPKVDKDLGSCSAAVSAGTASAAAAALGEGGAAGGSAFAVGASASAGDAAGAAAAREADSGDTEAQRVPEEGEAQVFAVASAMGDHLRCSARRRFLVRTGAFFDATLCSSCPQAPEETEVTLLDAVEELCSSSEESVSGGLARALRAELLRDPENQRALQTRRRPWYLPPPPPPTSPLRVPSAPSNAGAGDLSPHIGAGGAAAAAAGDASAAADGAAGATTVGASGEQGAGGPAGEAAADTEAEDRRAKRRRAAQQRQQRMLEDLKKRQAAFITGSEGQRMLEEAAPEKKEGDAEAAKVPECVICMSQQDDEQGENPLGLLCFLRPSAAGCMPRERVPVESAVLLKAQRPPGGAGMRVGSQASESARGLQCFSPEAPEGLVVARSCSHRMHFSCWNRFRPSALASGGGRLACPYCGTVANALLPAWSQTDVVGSGLALSSAPSLSVPAPLGAPTAAAALAAQASGAADASQPKRHAEATADFLQQVSNQLKKLGEHNSCLPEDLAKQLKLQHASEFLELAKLCADNVAAAEVRQRTRPYMSGGGASSSSAGAAAAATAGTGVAASVGGYHAVMVSCVGEALELAPPSVAADVASLALAEAGCGAMAQAIGGSLPHSRFQALTALLLSLRTGLRNSASNFTDDDGSGPLAWAARSLIYGFYLLEVVAVLGALASDELLASQVAAFGEAAAAYDAAASASASCADEGFAAAAAVWRQSAAAAAAAADRSEGILPLAPLRTTKEALEVLRLALNPFMAKVHLLLALLCPGYAAPTEATSWAPVASSAPSRPTPLAPADEHRLLARPDLGLPAVDDLLNPDRLSTFLAGPAGAPAESVWALTPQAVTHWLRSDCLPLLGRGVQPRSPLLLVLVVSDQNASVASASQSDGEDQVVVPNHVWQMTQEGFERLVAVSRSEVVELSSAPLSTQGKLFCVAYRFTLPVITGRVYQKFYTQFVHARCVQCRTTPAIPTLCLLCGTFLCCNSECCRKRGTDGLTLGEVTVHSQTCGFGACVFLQLSNSLVHIVADGFIASWGSLHLDEHGEEEYNLARPLHISEARLQQLTQSIREVSFDFESRLKWKKVIFV